MQIERLFEIVYILLENLFFKANRGMFRLFAF